MRGGASAPLHSVPHLTIPYESDDTASICSMEDFYKATGLTELVKDRTITDVRQIWMNKEVCEGLEEIVERNLRRQRKYRHWSDHTLHNAVAMDWLCYSPTSIPYIPEGELWIWTLEDADTAIEEYRIWIKENDTDDQANHR